MPRGNARIIKICKTIIDAAQNSGMRSPMRKSPNPAEVNPTSQGITAPPRPASTKKNPVSCDACLPKCRVKIARVVGNSAASPSPVRPAPHETVIRLLPWRRICYLLLPSRLPSGRQLGVYNLAASLEPNRVPSTTLPTLGASLISER